MKTESEKYDWFVDNMRQCVDLISTKIPDYENYYYSLKKDILKIKDTDLKLMKVMSFFKMLCREIDYYQSFI